MSKNYVKAGIVGVTTAIDFDYTEEEYVEKWGVLLDKCIAFKELCNLETVCEDICDVDECDIDVFQNDVELFEREMQKLHVDHDGVFPAPRGKHKTVTVVEEVGPATKMTAQAHIVDVDYEFDIERDLFIMLYTRIIGSDETVLLRVQYSDYFYIQVTDEMPEQLIYNTVTKYAAYLRTKRYVELRQSASGDFRKSPLNMSTDRSLILRMDVVEGLKSMYGYQPDDQTFVKVTTINPMVTNDLFNGLSKKWTGKPIEVFTWDGGVKEPTGTYRTFPEMNFFEARTDVTNKFMTQYGISGCSAIEFTGDRYSSNKVSTCTHLVDAIELRPLSDAPFYTPRTFFYDIECLARDINEFPTSDVCPIIQISYVCCKGSDKVSSGVLCLHETPGYESFGDEGGLLLAFCKKIVDFNPDYLTGFNSNCFDMPYIIDRMKQTKVHKVAGTMSRRRGLVVDYKRSTRSSKQFGTKEIVNYVIPGRVMFDQMEVFKGNPMLRLRSYALKSICANFLTPPIAREKLSSTPHQKIVDACKSMIPDYSGDEILTIPTDTDTLMDLYIVLLDDYEVQNNKEDLAYRDIPDLFKSPEGRVKIANYCLQDSIVLKKLDDKTMLGVDIAGQAKVQGITTNTVLNRGLVYRIMCKIKQYTERYNFLIPSFNKVQFPVSPTYQGATVLNCDAGYYEDPVVVLDFASLYPSLMRSHNLDYTTIALNKEQVEKYPERFQTFDNGYSFVKSEYLRGLLPRIETELGVERDNAKKMMKKATTPVEKAVWNAIQGGVKIVMNSIYGLSGSPTATVPCVPIAATITYTGRCHLAESKAYVEKHYCRVTGETVPARVIYGDTVSVLL